MTATEVRPIGLLVSDVDSTFLTQEVIDLIAEQAGSGAEVQDITERAMRGELDFAQSLRARVATLKGLPVGALAEVQVSLAPTEGAFELFERARMAGWVTALVSGGFHEVIDPLAAAAGIDHVLAHRFGVAEGRLTGEVEGRIVDGATKAATLRELAQRYAIDLARTVAIGDGANDIVMLQVAGTGIAFRAKPALRAVADVQLDGPSLLAAWPCLELVART